MGGQAKLVDAQGSQDEGKGLKSDRLRKLLRKPRRQPKEYEDRFERSREAVR